MIGDRLKEVRKYIFRDTQKQLARKLHVTLSTIQSWEQEKSSPNHEMLIAICKEYGVTSDYLLGLSATDPVFEKQAEVQLSPENYILLKQFEAFLLHNQKNKNKKHCRSRR